MRKSSARDPAGTGILTLIADPERESRNEALARFTCDRPCGTTYRCRATIGQAGQARRDQIVLQLTRRQQRDQRGKPRRARSHLFIAASRERKTRLCGALGYAARKRSMAARSSTGRFNVRSARARPNSAS